MKSLLFIMLSVMALVCTATAFAMPLGDKLVYKQIRLEYNGRTIQFKLPPKMEDFSQGEFVEASDSPLSDLMSLYYSLNGVDYYILLEKEGFEVLALACGFVVLNAKVFNYWIYRDEIPEPSTFKDVRQLEKQRILKQAIKGK